MTERPELTDAELLYGIAWTTPRGPWLELIRKRYPFSGGIPTAEPAKPVDNGTFLPGKLGRYAGIWICKKNGQTYRAIDMEKAWEDFKKTDAYKLAMRANPALKE